VFSSNTVNQMEIKLIYSLDRLLICRTFVDQENLDLMMQFLQAEKQIIEAQSRNLFFPQLKVYNGETQIEAFLFQE